MADDPLDQLYAVAPEEFTALRTRLAADAKKRGDAAGAKRITGARKPTMSAAVVNRLVHHEPEVRDRLGELGEELRAAHAAMDGERIRDLSGRQRKLIEQLTKAALEVSDVRSPTAALRDDVTDTLHAAIADPDVRSRLGRLAKAEHWSGFGEFGDPDAVFAAPEPAAPKKKQQPKPERPEKPAPKQSDRDDRERRRKREQARAVLSAAEHAKAEADQAMADRQSDLATARLRVEDAKERLARAENALAEADAAYEDAKRASREAGEVVKVAKAAVRDGG